MALPFFYSEEIQAGLDFFILNEDTSRHIVQVLRMQKGEQLRLTDGKGLLVTAEVLEAHKKRCTVKLLSAIEHPLPAQKNTIAISLIKNSSRFEWFLEKATEIGIGEIIPLICERTEKQHFRLERMRGILISAMLQSQQCLLPELHEPVKFNKAISNEFNGQKFIAHCEDQSNKQQLSGKSIIGSNNNLILIGPEGDFTAEEIDQAQKHDFIPVSLGVTRLRTETAGVVAVVGLNFLSSGD